MPNDKFASPKTSPLRTPFGERNGQLFAPHEVSNGLACACFCPKCEEPLVANHPHYKRPYFSHKNMANCPGGFESAVHKMAKQIIINAGWVMLPDLCIPVSASSNDDRDLAEDVVIENRPATLINIVAEQKAHDLVPDLTANLDFTRHVYIEIFVSHKVSEEKARALDNLMEIDLSGLDPEVLGDEQALATRVLTDAPRHWFLCSLYDDDPAIGRARSRVGLRVRNRRNAEQRREAKRLQQEHEREQQLWRSEREKERRSLEYDRPLSLLRRMATREAQDNHQEAMKEPEARRLTKAWEIKRDGGYKAIPVDTHIDFEWIINVARVIWQAEIHGRFIQYATSGAMIHTRKVTNTIVAEYGLIDSMDALIRLAQNARKNHRLRGRWVPELFSDDIDNRLIGRLPSAYAIVRKYLGMYTRMTPMVLKDENNGERFRVL